MTRLSAPAKLTTSLRVRGRRDDGYHLLEAEMTTLELADELELVEGQSGLEVRDEICWSGLPGGDDADYEAARPGSNLVERALVACGRQARCTLYKRVPAGAGLGGGSADAAAVLRWAGESDLSIAARLGADVPFCVVGGRARVSGIGEVVEPLDTGPEEASCFLLVTPRLMVSTPVVFAAFDEVGAGRAVSGNDLEWPALCAYPALAWWRDLLGAASGERPRLAGSGGSWFVEGRRKELTELAERLKGEILTGRESALVTVSGRTGPAQL